MLLLPYIEQTLLYQELNLSQPMGNQNTGYCCQIAGNKNGTLAGDAVASGNAAVMATPIPSAALSVGSWLHLSGQEQQHRLWCRLPISTCQDQLRYITSLDDFYRSWWFLVPGTQRYLFGQDSNSRFEDIKDGTSNTLAMGETTRTVYNGRSPCWGYRGWVMTGVDPTAGAGINDWTYTPTPNPPIDPEPGRLGSWGRAGSLHTGGDFFLLADGSVPSISQTTSTTVLAKLCYIADGSETMVP